MSNSEVTISFAKGQPSILVPSGSNLMKSLLEANLPVASSCDGEGVCSKCKIKIIHGKENLSRANDTEIFLKETNDISNEFRISCQTEVLGDVTVDATYW